MARTKKCSSCCLYLHHDGHLMVWSSGRVSAVSAIVSVEGPASAVAMSTAITPSVVFSTCSKVAHTYVQVTSAREHCGDVDGEKKKAHTVAAASMSEAEDGGDGGGGDEDGEGARASGRRKRLASQLIFAREGEKRRVTVGG